MQLTPELLQQFAERTVNQFVQDVNIFQKLKILNHFDVFDDRLMSRPLREHRLRGRSLMKGLDTEPANEENDETSGGKDRNRPVSPGPLQFWPPGLILFLF